VDDEPIRYDFMHFGANVWVLDANNAQRPQLQICVGVTCHPYLLEI